VKCSYARQLCDDARQLTGLADFGDASAMHAFDQLVASVERDLRFSDAGRTAAHERLLRVLVNRLRMQRDISRHPEILAQPMLPPVVITGLPRTGSTKLHRMLAATGTFQDVIFWQGFNPAPFADAADVGEDPRIGHAERFLRWRATMNPATNAAHFISAREPEEESYLLEMSFGTYYPAAFWNVPTYLEWLRLQDRDFVYLYLRQQLQYLQWQFHRQDVRPWILKSPPNLGFEREIARHFPGARFLMLHRDPAECIPSVAAVARESRRLYAAEPPDYPAIAYWALDEMASAMDRAMAWRATKPENLVLDIAYEDIHDREQDVAARVYEALGVPMTDGVCGAMAGWLRENTQYKHGRHQYSIDESGLTAAQIHSRFAAYENEYRTFVRLDR
jgi:hypothetical protein